MGYAGTTTTAWGWCAGPGARRHRGADPDPRGRALCHEGRRGDRGAAGVARAARGDGGEGAGQAGVAGEAALAGGAASKLVAAPTNYTAHIEEMAARAATQNIMPSPAIGTAGLFLKANSSLVGPSEGVAIRFPERRNEHEVELAIIFGKQAATSRAKKRSITWPATASAST